MAAVKVTAAAAISVLFGVQKIIPWTVYVMRECTNVKYTMKHCCLVCETLLVSNHVS